MAWIGIAVDAILKVLKSLFGMDKPAVTEVTNAKPETPLTDARNDDALLRDLGVQRDKSRSSN